MAREKEDFREQLQRLMERWPGQEVVPLRDVAEMLGCHPCTLRQDRTFPVCKLGGKTGRVVVPVVGLARWMCAS